MFLNFFFLVCGTLVKLFKYLGAALDGKIDLKGQEIVLFAGTPGTTSRQQVEKGWPTLLALWATLETS